MKIRKKEKNMNSIYKIEYITTVYKFDKNEYHFTTRNVKPTNIFKDILINNSLVQCKRILDKFYSKDVVDINIYNDKEICLFVRHYYIINKRTKHIIKERK